MEKKLVNVEKLIGKPESSQEDKREDDTQDKVKYRNEEILMIDERGKKRKGLIEQFFEAKEDLDILKQEQIKENTEKLKIISEELFRMSLDRKMNYFNKSQKEQLKKFLSTFLEALEEEKNKGGIDPMKVMNIYEENIDLIENITKNFHNSSLSLSLIEKHKKFGEEDNQLLTNLKTNIEESVKK